MYVLMYMHIFSLSHTRVHTHQHPVALQRSLPSPEGQLNHKSCCLCPVPQVVPRQLWSGHLCLTPMPLLTECPPLFLPLSHHLQFGLPWDLCTVLPCSKFPLPSCQWDSCWGSYLRKQDPILFASVCIGECSLCFCWCVSTLGCCN